MSARPARVVFALARVSNPRTLTRFVVDLGLPRSYIFLAILDPRHIRFACVLSFFFFLFPDKNVMRDGNCQVRTVSCVRGANGIRNRITKL